MRTLVAFLLAGCGASPAAAGERPPACVGEPLFPGAACAAEIAREGAIVRLRDPECRRLLADFSDASGHTLAQNLAAFGVSADQYLERLPLLDGSEHGLCACQQSQLLTTPGVRRILVCRSFLETVFRRRVMAEVYLIHEMLHTLGLGENPPSSHDITQRVIRRCAP